MKIRNYFMFLFAVLVLVSSNSLARDKILIVSSSATFTSSMEVAKRFGEKTDFKTPTVEAAGDAEGFKYFCSGTGANTPDIVGAARKISDNERELCSTNGISDIVEIQVGYAGVTMANSAGSENFNLSIRDLYLALAKNVPDGEGKSKPNPNQTWRDVNAKLPDTEIQVWGASHDRSMMQQFNNLAMKVGCETHNWIKNLKVSNRDAYNDLCATIRDDGAFIASDSNQALTAEAVRANPTAFGLFEHSFVRDNDNILKGAVINGIDPNIQNISNGEYALAQPLYMYVKKQHIDKVPGIVGYFEEYIDNGMYGSDPYLKQLGHLYLPGTCCPPSGYVVEQLR